MNTIVINPELYFSAQSYATEHKVDITVLVEQYLQRLLQLDKKTYALKEINELAPTIQQLVGVIPVTEEEKADLNGEKARMEYLQEKLGL